MKKLIEEVDEGKLIEEVDEGLIKLMGQRVTFFCMNYIYTGKLVGVNDKDVMLTEASIVYETGPLNDGQWKEAQELPHDLFIMTNSIESYMVLK